MFSVSGTLSFYHFWSVQIPVFSLPVDPANAEIHWFTLIGRPNRLCKRTSLSSGFLLPQE